MQYKVSSGLQKTATKLAAGYISKCAWAPAWLKRGAAAVANTYNSAVEGLSKTAPFRWAGEQLAGTKAHDNRLLDNYAKMYETGVKKGRDVTPVTSIRTELMKNPNMRARLEAEHRAEAKRKKEQLKWDDWYSWHKKELDSATKYRDAYQPVVDLMKKIGVPRGASPRGMVNDANRRIERTEEYLGELGDNQGRMRQRYIANLAALRRIRDKYQPIVNMLDEAGRRTGIQGSVEPLSFLHHQKMRKRIAEGNIRDLGPRPVDYSSPVLNFMRAK